MGHRYDKMKALKGPKQTEPYVFFFIFLQLKLVFTFVHSLKLKIFKKV